MHAPQRLSFGVTMRFILILFIFIVSNPAFAEQIMIPWSPGDPAAEVTPWAVVNAAEINGWTKNFKNDKLLHLRREASDVRADRKLGLDEWQIFDRRPHSDRHVREKLCQFSYDISRIVKASGRYNTHEFKKSSSTRGYLHWAIVCDRCGCDCAKRGGI